MKSVLVALLFLLVVAPMAISQDSDNDGLPDALDHRPSVATYYQNTAPERQNPLAQPSDRDSDNDGVPDVFDNRPYVAEYPNAGQRLRSNPMLAAEGIDSDGDGLADRIDMRPYVMTLYKGTAPMRQDPMAQPADLDSDWDGVPDNQDNRPYVKEYPYFGATPMAEKPKMDGDADGDGVADSKDRCPGTPAGVAVDANGCPKDSDGDGVADDKDKCPGTPAGTPVDANGCPKDSDGDGVADHKDKCPGTPAGVAVDANGCPRDSDGDGVTDNLDKCPGTAAGIAVDETGCPKLIKKGEKITLNILFATNSVEMDGASMAKLDAIAQTMNEFGDIKVSITGFTDDRGAASHNKSLSENRAKAVLDYLAGKGVDRGRMRSAGRGEDPKYFVGDNKTEEGRQANRRVEIESVE